MATQKTVLGALETANLRDAWKHEAQDFTPWLAENLDRLTNVLGIELEKEDTEVQVGPYRADIVARAPMDDCRVVIENQLEEANLQHLGQVLAYLAGLDARIVVWIARDFDEAHLSAIRWLNDHTVDPYAFFAVRVRVVRIGDSPLAPVFEVLQRPSNWDRNVRDTATRGDLSDRGRFRRDFWAHVATLYPNEVKPGFAGSNVNHHVKDAGLRISQYVARHSVGIFLGGTPGESNEAVLSRIDPYLEQLRTALEGEHVDKLGSSLGGSRPPIAPTGTTWRNGSTIAASSTNESCSKPKCDGPTGSGSRSKLG